jgi:putative spermidine/putrescine transport system permease protein
MRFKKVLNNLATSDWQLALPLTLFLQIFYLAPLLILLVTSLQSKQPSAALSLSNYVKFFSDRDTLGVLWDTLWLGVQVTLLCLILGYPLAYVFTFASAQWQKWLTFLIALPILTSVVVRTFAWVVILGREGIVNSVLINLGITSTPIKLLFTHLGVVIALTEVQLPLMVVPLIAAMVRLDKRLIDASASLGGGSWRTFWRISFPLTLPGIISGCLLVFVSAINAFITQSIVGGGQIIYMPTYIYQQALTLLNWPFAAAISIILLASVLVIVVAFNTLDKLTKSYTHS